MSSTIEVRAPQEQSDGTRSQVQRWLKAIGEAVTENEPLIEVETDKVTIEIPSPATGVLQEILKQEQEEIEPGELLARIAVGGTAAGDAAAGVTGTEVAAHEASAAISGGSASSARDARGAATASAASTGAAARQLSPAVRRLLAERGLDASAVRGTGEGGRITVDDVLAHAVNGARADTRGVASSNGSVGAGLSAAGKAQQPAATTTTTGRLVPHSNMRKRIAERMVDSLLHTAPHVTTVFEVDMTNVLAHRAKHRADFESRGASLTLTAYILTACVAGIREVPEVNSRWTDDALELFDEVDIGVGTALEGKGLVVPVVRNVQSLDLFGIARELGDLVYRAREDKLTPADVRGGTFTISNHGVSGSLVATPIIINQPQSSILGVGKLEKRAVVITENGEDRVVVRPRCYVTLTIDHRVMDGHRANRFMEVLVRTLDGWPV